MIDLITATELAFAPGGPVEQLFGQHRPEQAECAIKIACALSRAHLSTDDRKCLTLGQILPGTGKTLAYSVVLSFYVILMGSETHAAAQAAEEAAALAEEEGREPAETPPIPVYRGMVSTFTKALRAEIADPKQVRAVNDIVQAILPGSHDVVFAERKSATGFHSKERGEWLRGIAKTYKPDSPERRHAEEYLTWADSNEVGEFDDWLEHPASDGHLPFGMSELELCLTEEEVMGSETNPAVKSYFASLKEASNAHIVVVTHSKTLHNVVSFGQGLNTNRFINALIIDEADRLPQVARRMNDRMVPLRFIERTIADAPRPIRRRAASKAFKDLQKHLRSKYVGHATWPLMNRAEMLPVHELAEALIEALDEMMEQYKSLKDHWHLEQVVSIHNTLARFTQLMNYGGTLNGGYMIDALSEGTPIVEYMPNVDNIRLGVKPKRPADLVHGLWRHKSHLFESITFVSGTMFGLNNSFSAIMNRLGIIEGSREEYRGDWVNRLDEMVLEPRRFGRITHLVTPAGSGFPMPSLRVPITTADGEFDFTDPAYAVYVADAITLAASDPSNGRLLCLFASEKALLAVARLTNLADRLIVQRSGRRADALMDQYAARPDMIWLGMNWEGVNFVKRNDDGSSTTLPNTVMITKLPIMPADSVIETLFNFKVSLNERLDDAFRKTVQGLYRAIRQPSDIMRLWMLDPRWPVHKSVINAFGYAKINVGIADQEQDDSGIIAQASQRSDFYQSFAGAVPKGLLTGASLLDAPAYGALIMDNKKLVLKMIKP